MKQRKKLKNYNRIKNDRNYQVNDMLSLNEYYKDKKIYTGRHISDEILYILNDNSFLKKRYIILSFYIYYNEFPNKAFLFSQTKSKKAFSEVTFINNFTEFRNLLNFTNNRHAFGL